jgi:hypothetical protein
MLSERLRSFLAGWGDADAAPQEAAAMLRSPEGTAYRRWLPAELGAAIRSGELTPAVLTDLTSVRFQDQQAVDRWLRQRWSMWFAEPYPGD